MGRSLQLWTYQTNTDEPQEDKDGQDQDWEDVSNSETYETDSAEPQEDKDDKEQD